MNNLKTYLDARFSKLHVFTVDLIFQETGLDKEDVKDHKRVYEVCRKFLKLHQTDVIPQAISIMRGKMIISELLCE